MKTKINNERVIAPGLSAETGSRGAEDQVSLYDGRGEVRNRILNAPDWMGGEVILPKGAVVVSMHADEVGGSSAIEMSTNVGDLLGDHHFSSSVNALDGYRKVGRFTRLSSLKSLLFRPPTRHDKLSLGRTDHSVAFIYDGATSPNSETSETIILPSVMLVRGELTADQLKDLREQFPGVPFVNGKNELLDDVGRAERQEAREKYEQELYLGEVALKAKAAEASRRRAEGVAAFLRNAKNIKVARQTASFKGGKFHSETSTREKPKFNKTHIPKTKPENLASPSLDTKPSGELNITPEASATDIASQALDKIVPKGVVMTREKMNKFSNEVKKALSKERIHPDVDERAKDVYSKVDDELIKRRNESRIS